MTLNTIQTRQAQLSHNTHATHVQSSKQMSIKHFNSIRYDHKSNFLTISDQIQILDSVLTLGTNICRILWEHMPCWFCFFTPLSTQVRGNQLDERCIPLEAHWLLIFPEKIFCNIYRIILKDKRLKEHPGSYIQAPFSLLLSFICLPVGSPIQQKTTGIVFRQNICICPFVFFFSCLK